MYSALGRRVEALEGLGEPRRRDREERRRHGHDHDRPGQDGLAERVRGVLVRPAKAGEDRDERGGQAGCDQHVERDLRDPERGVVGVELGAGAVGVREDAVADEAHPEVREAQDGQDDGATREDDVDEPADPADRPRQDRHPLHSWRVHPSGSAAVAMGRAPRASPI